MNGFCLRSAPVGAKPGAAGTRAPRLSLTEEELRLLFLLFEIKINEAAGMIPFPDS